jgi:hypothetical protein
MLSYEGASKSQFNSITNLICDCSQADATKKNADCVNNSDPPKRHWEFRSFKLRHWLISDVFHEQPNHWVFHRFSWDQLQITSLELLLDKNWRHLFLHIVKKDWSWNNNIFRYFKTSERKKWWIKKFSCLNEVFPIFKAYFSNKHRTLYKLTPK